MSHNGIGVHAFCRVVWIFLLTQWLRVSECAPQNKSAMYVLLRNPFEWASTTCQSTYNCFNNSNAPIALHHGGHSYNQYPQRS